MAEEVALAPQRPVVTLYTRADCPLCDEAEAILRRLRGALGYRLETVDVDSGAVFARRYGLLVPVVAVGDAVIATAPIAEAALRAALGRALRVP